MFQRAALAALGIAVCALAYGLHAQQARIERLSTQLQVLSERPVGSSVTVGPQPTAAVIGSPAAKELAPRAVVGPEELARIESAVLTLLDSEHPELRSKLQAAVQREQHAAEQQQRDARRDRWAARREARLRAVSEAAGISAEQRDAVLTIMLANRDQLEELRREAQTPEQMATLRTRAKALRDAADAQIRSQLSPEQYRALRHPGDDEDDERQPAPDRVQR